MEVYPLDVFKSILEYVDLGSLVKILLTSKTAYSVAFPIFKRRFHKEEYILEHFLDLLSPCRTLDHDSEYSMAAKVFWTRLRDHMEECRFDPPSERMLEVVRDHPRIESWMTRLAWKRMRVTYYTILPRHHNTRTSLHN